jgi:hypothetical protein
MMKTLKTFSWIKPHFKKLKHEYFERPMFAACKPKKINKNQENCCDEKFMTAKPCFFRQYQLADVRFPEPVG